jgi:uracil-DNA glycosylase family 4
LSESVVAEMERLNAEVEACTRCPLHLDTTHGVPGEGKNDADIMLVGEGPGFNEDKQGRPFVGAAGRFLEELLSIAHLERADVYITNVVKHRPPNNRDPEPGELAACRTYLERQIQLIEPKVIVTLGRYSLGTFFPGDKISAVHGRIRERGGKHFFNMYHPAAALHQQALRQTLLDDMKRLADFIEGPMKDVPKETRDTVDQSHEDPEQLSFF